MSNTEPDEQFVSEDELRALLDRWPTPKPSELLDRRVSSSYLREMSRSGALRNSILLSANDNEVVAMKLCSTCHDEFADKFSFCPVDGTPLSAVAARHDESDITAGADNGGAIPLQNEPARASAGVASYAGAATSSALVMREEYHLTIMDDASLARRLAHELKDVAHEYQLTWPEFKRDPFGFTKRSVVGYGQMLGRFFDNRNVVIAMGGAFLGMVALVGAIALLDRSQSKWTARIGLGVFGLGAFCALVAVFATWLGKERGAAVMGAQPSDSQSVAFGMVTAFVFIFAILGGLIFLERREESKARAAALAAEDEVAQIIDIPENQPTPDPGTAGMAKGSGGGSKPKQDKAGGGGGGGREEQKPASAGKTPQADLDIPQVLPPDPHPVIPKNPVLQIPPSLDADKTLFPPDTRNVPYGMKTGPTDPSSGPGKNGGMGNGEGMGMGPGQGGGYGPGRGGNTGGGDRHEGGGGPGGGGGGTDYNRVFAGKDVTQKARVLSKPEPQYTEDARKNQVTGTVVLRVVFTSGGQVTDIRAVKQLPYGLTEKAMAAARQINFIPAMKDGHAVSMYMQLEYNFNLY